jgi:O-Antigen ligase
LSTAARATFVLSAAAAVGLQLVLSSFSLQFWTLLSAAAAAILSFRAPAVIPPIAASPLYIAPVIVLALTGRSHFSALTPLLGILVTSIAVAGRGAPALPVRLRAALTCWALVLAFSWPIVVLREIDFTWSLLRNFRVPTAAGGFPPPAVVIWIAHVAATQLVGILWFDYLWTRHATATIETLTRRVVWPLAGTALAACALGAYQGVIDTSFLSTSVWPFLRRAAGALVDANASGILSAMWIFGFVALAATSNRASARSMAGLGAVIAAIATWSSGSRSALLAATVGGIAVAAGVMRDGRIRSKRAVAALSAAAVLFLLLGLGAGRFLRLQTISPVERLTASVPRASELANWLWTRDGYGTAANYMIRDFPLAGIGIGTFHSIVADYSRTFVGRPLPPDNAQNWFRHQLAELGILGSLGCFIFVGAFAAFVVRAKAPDDLRLSTSALAGALAGCAAASLVGVPGQHPAIVLTFWTFAFWLLRLLGKPGDDGAAGPPRFLLICLIAGVLAHAGATLYYARHDLRVPFRAARFDFDYTYGLTKDDEGRFWVHDRAVVVPRATTRAVRLTMWGGTGAEPVAAKVSVNGNRAIRRTLRGTQPVTDVIAVPGDNKRFVLDLSVDGGRLGVRWEFVQASAGSRSTTARQVSASGPWRCSHAPHARKGAPASRSLQTGVARIGPTSGISILSGSSIVMPIGTCRRMPP